MGANENAMLEKIIPAVYAKLISAEIENNYSGGEFEGEPCADAVTLTFDNGVKLKFSSEALEYGSDCALFVTPSV